ncbi:hypothetical protein [Azospirillum sp. TSO22-1]|uniref:hypothetical protein n=1 Tax=Azospirillum sp. TSO22-1 TaxID=716789 RepID=UPI000D616354|nr:hypothetical protein [Azospirillum sp. TSO22-1]PWC35315.1 hypothetical protein TSO221_30040 [Azospirillum sp. TSO22-1]
MADDPKPPGKTPETAPGEQRQDRTRTPGDGTLDGAVPAGLTSDELRRRAERPNTSSDGGAG